MNELLNRIRNAQMLAGEQEIIKSLQERGIIEDDKELPMKVEKHKWKQVDLPEKLKPEFKAMHICVRGDCKCERLTSSYDNLPTYSRSGIIYDRTPECYGDIPINNQTID